MTLRRWLYARPGSSDDSGAPLVRHPANGVRGVRAQMRRRPERPYSKRIVQNRPFLRQLRTSASTTDQLSRNPGTLDLASAALDELKARPTGARRVLKWPRQAIHPCSKRTTQSGNRGWRLLITRQAGCCTRPELLVSAGHSLSGATNSRRKLCCDALWGTSCCSARQDRQQDGERHELEDGSRSFSAFLTIPGSTRYDLVAPERNPIIGPCVGTLERL